MCNKQRPHSALGYQPPAPETRTFAPVSVSAWRNLNGGLTTGADQTSMRPNYPRSPNHRLLQTISLL